METKFKAGDKFIPRKPKEDYYFFEWVSNMDKYEGKELVVEDIVEAQELQCPVLEGWVFHPDWCEKVDQFPDVGKKVEPMKAGIEGISDEHIERYYPHIKASTLLPQPQTRSTEINWEQRRYELAKEFMAAILTGLITSKADWLDVTEVGNAIDIANEMIKQLKG